ncbi:polysaccharide pyruvyl transferase CsaB [Sporosalibacterium faouarense]|uniref:polysaccharide pyruvyl transferase CsaB n=1 Tax=Sporosalibacterium faouarense TaxID=516123 RepID=UPI00141C46A6|nr:polysaccharide pyruvyl transferase CsaB [Sporosalibacterium faouarense]MTI48645.1 polysaccharide pyruvyl transferase CsaB [Bacillota bacterium]
MKKIFVFGYYGFKNCGDDAILDSIISNLKNINKDLKISALTYDAEYTKGVHGVSPVSRSKLFDIIKNIRDCDLLISGGGSLLQDVTSSRSLIFYLSLIFIAKFFKKKVMFFCNGYGPVKKKLNKLLINKIVNKVDLITLRDEESAKELKKIGITENVIVAADAAFTMEPANEERIDEIMDIEGIPKDKEIIGISVRRWTNDEKTKNVIAKTVDYLSTKDRRVVLIPMKYPDDVEFSLEIKEMCETNPYVVENYYKPKEVLGIIGKFEILIGIRLHALIFGAIANVPVVGIEYDPKIKGFLQLIDGVNSGDINKLDFTHLCLCIEEVWNNRDKYKNKLAERKVELKEKVLNVSEKVIELLESENE